MTIFPPDTISKEEFKPMSELLNILPKEIKNNLGSVELVTYEGLSTKLNNIKKPNKLPYMMVEGYDFDVMFYDHDRFTDYYEVNPHIINFEKDRDTLHIGASDYNASVSKYLEEKITTYSLKLKKGVRSPLFVPFTEEIFFVLHPLGDIPLTKDGAYVVNDRKEVNFVIVEDDKTDTSLFGKYANQDVEPYEGEDEEEMESLADLFKDVDKEEEVALIEYDQWNDPNYQNTEAFKKKYPNAIRDNQDKTLDRLFVSDAIRNGYDGSYEVPSLPDSDHSKEVSLNSRKRDIYVGEVDEETFFKPLFQSRHELYDPSNADINPSDYYVSNDKLFKQEDNDIEEETGVPLTPKELIQFRRGIFETVEFDKVTEVYEDGEWKKVDGLYERKDTVEEDTSQDIDDDYLPDLLQQACEDGLIDGYEIMRKATAKAYGVPIDDVYEVPELLPPALSTHVDARPMLTRPKMSVEYNLVEYQNKKAPVGLLNEVRLEEYNQHVNNFKDDDFINYEAHVEEFSKQTKRLGLDFSYDNKELNPFTNEKHDLIYNIPEKVRRKFEVVGITQTRDEIYDMYVNRALNWKEGQKLVQTIITAPVEDLWYDVTRKGGMITNRKISVNSKDEFVQVTDRYFPTKLIYPYVRGDILCKLATFPKGGKALFIPYKGITLAVTGKKIEE